MALHDPKCDITFPFLFFRFRKGKYDKYWKEHAN